MQYIGFTTKYYTLWNVSNEGEYTYYQYIQNLSMDFEKAKAKRPNALIDLTLRGHKSFRIKNTIPTDCYLFGKFKNEPLVEHIDDLDYMAWYCNHLDAETYKEKAQSILVKNGYKLLNGKAYSEKDYDYQLMLEERFPMFKEKVDNRMSFKFKPNRNCKIGYDAYENRVATLDIAFCHIIFKDMEEKEYNGHSYAIPCYNGSNCGVFIKGRLVEITDYTATPIDDRTFEIVVNSFKVY